MDDDALDSLTGLPGRDTFLERTSTAIAGADAETLTAVLLLDIDGFRTINEAHGLQAGDAVIAVLARRLLDVTRRDDAVARVGGDEFALLFTDLHGDEEARMVATRLKWSAEREYQLPGGTRMQLRISLGMVIGPSATPSAEAMLRDAGMAMYSAKAAGGGQLVVFTEDLGRRTARRFALQSAVREGLDNGEFELHYQTLFALSPRRVAGTEALLRWQHPDRGWISPADFVPAAEDTGLIVTLGHWVMRTAMGQLAAWRKLGHAVTMSINVSAHQLAHPDLLFQVRDALNSTGVPPSAIMLEVTESQVMRNLDVAFPAMRTLRSFGVGIAIDDFGTGYASLAQLKSLPADELKIDRSFIVDLESGMRDVGIVRAIIEVAHTLELDVVAEGVETIGQLRILERLGCDLIQGYLLARPMPADGVRFDPEAGDG